MRRPNNALGLTPTPSPEYFRRRPATTSRIAPASRSDDEPVVRLVELIKDLLDVVPDRLDARDVMRIERRVVRTPCGTAAHFHHCIEVIPMHLMRLGIGPLTLPGERLVLRPQPVRECHRPELVP